MSATADVLLETLAELVAERVVKLLDGRDRKPETTETLPDFYSETQLSKRCGISRRTLQKWRALGGGPPTVKAGSRVLYPRVDVDQWLKGHTRRRTTRR
jgi:predicted DNA-binding transcriptional regulator AlpA